MVESIRPTSDRKTRAWGRQKNTFGLTHIVTCPGATYGVGGCCEIKPGRKTKVCYVDSLVRAYTNILPALKHNTQLLMGSSREQQTVLLIQEFKRFYDAEIKHAKRVGTEPHLWYRWHWSGDFFDPGYVDAGVDAMREFPELKFWAYTRSFFAVPKLAEVKNLVTYISLDIINMRDGMQTYYDTLKNSNNGNVQVAYMSPERVNDFDTRWEAVRCKDWPTYPVKMDTCPVDTGKLPLEGGCTKCRKCLSIGNLPPIWFCP